MGGGLIQLVAFGSQDVHLSGNPQITFWKVVYKRHTNFSIEPVEQTFYGAPSSNGGHVVATISRNGDLIHKCFLVMNVPEDKEVSSITEAHNLIQSVELEIGGQTIDKHYGDWMTIWNELSLSEDKKAGYESMVTKKNTVTSRKGKIYIPLQFFFNENPGLALPLIALQYHDVRFKIFFHEKLGDFLGPEPEVKLWVDYIYLDSDERRQMAQASHEFLIRQLQTNTSNVMHGQLPVNANLHFNHPVKEVLWVVDQDETTQSGSKLGHLGTLHALSQDSIHNLSMNGHNRIYPREGRYFSHVQPYQHHSRVPNGDFLGKINVYSFALKPEEFQPSGSCNFSRIENAQLTTKTGDTLETNDKKATLKIFATNWNVLRIENGMGGIVFSN